LFFQQLTSKDKPHQQECRFPMLQSECKFEEMREFAYTSTLVQYIPYKDARSSK